MIQKDILVDVSPLIQDHMGGVSRVIREMIHQITTDAQSGWNYQFLIYAPRALKRDVRERMKLLTDLPITIWSMPARWYQSAGWRLPVYFQTKGYRYRNTIYHSFDWYHFGLGHAGSAMVYDLTPVTHPEFHSEDNIISFKRRMNRLIQLRPHVFCISEATRKDWMRISQMPIEKTGVVPLGMGKELSRARPEIAINLARPFLLYVATLEPRKNHERLLAAYNRWNGKRSYALILAGGPGWKSDSLRQYLNNADENIHWLTPSDGELRWLWQHAAGCVYPSLVEGFGLPILEAMYNKLPILCSDVPALREIGGTDVLYAEPTSVDSLLQGLNQLQQEIELPNKSYEYGSQLRKFRYSHTLEHMKQAWSRM